MQSSLEHDALSLHFVMAYPNLQGIHLKDAALPVYSKEASEASAASRQKFLSVLSFLCLLYTSNQLIFRNTAAQFFL